MAMGFNAGKNETSIYDTFIGRPGHYGVGGVTVTGVLKEVNMNEGYFTVQPSIVGRGEAEMKLETESPTIICFEKGNPISMRPLGENDLELIIEAGNEAIQTKKADKPNGKNKRIIP